VITATAESERAFAELCRNPSADPTTRRLLTAGFDAKGLLGNDVRVEEGRALAFVTLVVANAVLILSCRSAHSGWTDMFVVFSSVGAWVITGTLIGLAITTLVPAIAGAFIFVPPAVPMWLAAFVTGGGMLVVFETGKAVLRWIAGAVV